MRLQLSVFLMGVYDKGRGRWCTVCRVGNGHDDKTIDRLTREMIPRMTRIGHDKTQLPIWLEVGTEDFDWMTPFNHVLSLLQASIVPEFVVKEPMKAPVRAWSRSSLKLMWILKSQRTGFCVDLILSNSVCCTHQVWEVVGAEFSQSDRHTALDAKGKGMSIRFPRVCTRMSVSRCSRYQSDTRSLFVGTGRAYS